MNTAQNLITNAHSQAHPDLLNLKLRDGGGGGGAPVAWSYSHCSREGILGFLLF